MAAGRGSLARGAPTGAALGSWLSEIEAGGGGPWDEHTSKAVSTWYAEARLAADRWAKARDDFMLERLRAGRHPDTDQQFWDGWDEDEIALPTPPGGAFPDNVLNVVGLGGRGPPRAVKLFLVGVCVVLVAMLVVVVRRRGSRKPRPAGRTASPAASAAET